MIKPEPHCCNCKKWRAGEFWGNNINETEETKGFVVLCQGYCKYRKHRWNYQKPCRKFEVINKESFIYHGCGDVTDADIENIIELTKDLLK